MITKIISEIKKAKEIIIYRHVSPDGDALGSQYGLKAFINLNFPKINVYAINPEDETMNGIFPEGDKLPNKIKNCLVIIVDTANTDRISGLKWSEGTKIIKIDHHPNTDDYGDIKLVNVKYAATAEIITEIITSDPKFKIDKLIAKYLLTGIITDTGSFRYSSVSENTLLMASRLWKTNVKSQVIYDSIYRKSLKQIKYNGFVLSNFKVKNNVAYFIAPKKIESKYDVSYSYVSSSVGMLMGPIEVKYAMYVSWDQRSSFWRISLRSKAKPVNKIAQKFGGGGHTQACGLKLKNKKDIKKIMKELLKLQ
ncbi:MAG: hypothetical protein GQ557_02810 [Mycoplasmataceae bacterium]|nr:hypothetical protein [Mycoplasmataceae bacterium]